MIDYVNVRKPSPLKMWLHKNRESLKYGAILVAVVLVSMLGAACQQ